VQEALGRGARYILLVGHGYIGSKANDPNQFLDRLIGFQNASAKRSRWSRTCTLRTSSGGKFHLSEISGLRTCRNYPLRTSIDYQ